MLHDSPSVLCQPKAPPVYKWRSQVEITRNQADLLEKIAKRLQDSINNIQGEIEEDWIGNVMAEARHLANIILLVLNLAAREDNNGKKSVGVQEVQDVHKI